MGIWGNFQGLTEATGEGRGVKKRVNRGDVVYGWSLTACTIHKDTLSVPIGIFYVKTGI